MSSVAGRRRLPSIAVLARSQALSAQSEPWWTPRHARVLAFAVLHELPDRLAHCLQAGRQAHSVAHTVAPGEADLLVTAALLHDIGYAADLRRTGFHPLDGAQFLIDLDAPPRLAALVAHHSESRFLADAYGLGRELRRHRHECGPVSDALTYADMTAGPAGVAMSLEERLADIASRHAADAPALAAARAARLPHLRGAAERVQRRAATTGARRADVWRVRRRDRLVHR